MMRKRNFLVALMLTALASLPFSASGQRFLVLTQSDGSTAEFALADHPVITIDGGTLLLTCGEQQISTSLDGAAYSFSDTSTAIRHTTEQTEPQARLAFGEAVFTGLKAGCRVAVFNTSGQMLLSTTASADGQAAISLASLPRGVYILKAQGITFKVQK